MNRLAVPSIEPDEAAADHTALLLDVREDLEWNAGHAPAAVHIAMGELMARVDELPRDRRIICACRSGNRSAQVTAWLLQQGFQAVNLHGGMGAWSSFGHPFVNFAGHPGVLV